MNSLPKQLCKHCISPVTKIYLRKSRGKKIFIDENERQWFGAKCPDCRAKDQAKNYLKRKKDRIDYMDI